MSINTTIPVEAPESDDLIEQERAAVEEIISIRKITADNAVFSRTSGGFLALDYDGKQYGRVDIHRCFPFSDPTRFISVRATDADAKEIGIIEDLAVLPDDVCGMLEEQMGLRYFTPIIQQVHDIKEEYGYVYWEVTTDRGRCKFTTRMGGGSVFTVGKDRYLVNDIDGNRFEIPDLYALTPAEIKKLDLFI